MSIRNDVFDNFVATIKGLPPSKIGKVTTKPVDFAKLSRASFPIIHVTVESESRELIAMGGCMMGTMNVDVTCYVQGEAKTKDAFEQLDLILELIENEVEIDETRGGKALLTELQSIGGMDESAFPIVSQTQTYIIQYTYISGVS